MSQSNLNEALRNLAEKRHTLTFARTIIEGYGYSDQFEATLHCLNKLEKSLLELDEMIK